MGTKPGESGWSSVLLKCDFIGTRLPRSDGSQLHDAPKIIPLNFFGRHLPSFLILFSTATQAERHMPESWPLVPATKRSPAAGKGMASALRRRKLELGVQRKGKTG